MGEGFNIMVNQPSEEVSSPDVIDSSAGVDTQETSGAKDQSPPDRARQRLATIYVVGFLGIITLILILSFFKGFDTNHMKDLLLTASGVLSGPLGFIIGYYFKSREG